jgi:hypothetical protein
MIGTRLNVQEARHRLARRIAFGNRGQLRRRYREGMEDQIGSLGLALNAVVWWNSLYLDAAEPLIDPRAYLERLPELAPELPPGAREFATEPGHYDFYGQRCVKDLKLRFQTWAPEANALELSFRHNCWKHEEDLTIRYAGLRSLHTDLVVASVQVSTAFDVVLDEVLPYQGGCLHEIGFWGGTMVVAADDLAAVWTGADCPDRPH